MSVPAGTFAIVVSCTQVDEFFSAEGRLVFPPKLLNGMKDSRETLIVKAESRDRDLAVSHALAELAAKISGGR